MAFLLSHRDRLLSAMGIDISELTQNQKESIYKTYNRQIRLIGIDVNKLPKQQWQAAYETYSKIVQSI